MHKNREHNSSTNFIEIAQKSADKEANSGTGLCCCEYIDRENRRFHILGCCCNCEDFDLVFTRFITCHRIDRNNWLNMLLTFQDRLRIPWQGGAKQLSMDGIISALAVPLVICLAAINLFAAVTIFICCIVCLGYAYYLARRTKLRTRFFFLWIFWTVIDMLIIFEYTVPLHELMLEENLILGLLTVAAITCFHYTKKRAILNHVVQSQVAEDELPDITEASAAEEEEAAAAQTTLLLEHDLEILSPLEAQQHQANICSNCRKYVPARTVHCAVCGVCIMHGDHHSYWLNCCIGASNHRHYLAGLILALLALLLGANLCLTAICHPFLVTRIFDVVIVLPDDCSEVFEDYYLGLSFVISVYALLISLYIFISLIKQIYLISRGVTMQECQQGQCSNRRSLWSNWKLFATKMMHRNNVQWMSITL